MLAATDKSEEGRALRRKRAMRSSVAAIATRGSVPARRVLFHRRRIEIRLLTKDRLAAAPSSLALVDGEPPRLVKVASLDRRKPRRGFEQVLRDAIPFTADWLEARVALAMEQHADEVGEVSRRIAAGEPTGEYGVRVPAVVAAEALRRRGAARDSLLAGLVTPQEPIRKSPPKREIMDDCGLGMLLVSPLGARFADAFAKTPQLDGERAEGVRRRSTVRRARSVRRGWARRTHEGSLTTDFARQAPAVVVLEIARRTDSVRDQLMDVLRFHGPRRPGANSPT